MAADDEWTKISKENNPKLRNHLTSIEECSEDTGKPILMRMHDK